MENRLYRGFKDIMPSEISPIHSNTSDNIFGNSIGYFTKEKNIAEAYAFNRFSEIGVVIEYKINSSNILELIEKQDFNFQENSVLFSKSGLIKTGLTTNKIDKDSFANTILSLGYDAISLTRFNPLSNDHEGADHCVILANPSLLTPIKLSIATKEFNENIKQMGDLGGYDESSYKLIYGNGAFNYYPTYNIAYENVDKLEDELKKGL